MKRRFGNPDLDWLHPENFADEPVYCEAPETPDDILCHGSDDEAYETPADRRRRIETQAHRFLEGKPVFLLSASLRGPFDKKSGWVNPWRSKSASKVTSAHRRRPPRARQVVERHEVNDSFEAAPAPTPIAEPLPRYMDGPAFRRVCDWRNMVVAETEVAATPSQEPSQTQPTSADSRRATQQTHRRRSGWTVGTLDDGTRSSIPFTQSFVNNDGESALAAGSDQDDDQAVSSLPTRSRPGVGSGQPAATHAADIVHRPVMDAMVPTPDETASESTPAVAAPAEQLLAANLDLNKEHATPNGIPQGATSASALLRTRVSARTDGSFRYRRDARERGSSPAGSKLVAPPAVVNDLEEPPLPVDRSSPGAAEEDDEAAKLDASSVSEDAGVDLPEGVEESDEPVPEPDVQDTLEDALGPDAASESESGSGIDEEDAETTSQIDGPTLVPSGSSPDSQRSSMPSVGHFSPEKQSQEMAERFGSFRRLLWPKSRPSRDSLPAFALESAHTPASPPRLDLSPASPLQPVSVPQNVSQSNEEGEDAELPAEVPTCPPIDGSAIVEAIQEEAEDEPVSGHPSESETASEAECEEGVQETSQAEAEEPSELAEEDNSKLSRAPAPADATPEIEGPLAAIETESVQSTPPKVAQSPWVKDTNVLPDDASGMPAQVTPQLAGPGRPSPAKRTLEAPVSQSPWTRGDSQLQMPPPDVRAFNPLSSPGPEPLLPPDPCEPVLPIAPSELTRRNDDDYPDMRNSQLYPPHPSTPETKHSSLPTPDATFSAKSFSNFMTPSPQKRTKRRRVSAASSSHLPSTQALLDAAVSNPWTRPPTTKKHRPSQKRKSSPQEDHEQRPKKRVSFGPLPGEEEEEEGDDENEDPIATPAPARHHRTGSPPPSILLSASSLPGENQKFGKHFAAAVAAGRRRTTAAGRGDANASSGGRSKTSGGGGNGKGAGSGSDGDCDTGNGKGVRLRMARRLLPSASQVQRGGCESPGVEAMAEAFLRGDLGAPVGEAGEVGVDDEGEGKEEEEEVEATSEGASGEEGDVVGDGGVDGNEVGGAVGEEDEEEAEEEEEEEEEALGGGGILTDVILGGVVEDEVSAVMENLDDFLGGQWDLDAELAKARRQEGGGSGSGYGMNCSDGFGLMDVGVWD